MAARADGASAQAGKLLPNVGCHHLSHLRLRNRVTAPQMLGHGETFSAAGVPCARVAARVLRNSVRAASSHAAPTQPRFVTVACTSVKPPTAAEREAQIHERCVE